MAMTATGIQFVPAPHHVGLALANQAIDASGEKAASIFTVPKTGNIDRIIFMVGTAATPQPLQIGLETLDAAGDPSGTQYGGSAVGAVAAPTAATQFEVTLATPAAATKGDDIACVIQYSGSIGNLSIRTWNPTLPPGKPYTDLYTGAWTKGALYPAVAVRYDDGIWYDTLTLPLSATTSYAFNSGTGTADEYGLQFQVPVSRRIVGAWVLLLTTAGSDFELILYSGTTALLTKAITAINKQAVGAQLVFLDFGASYDLAANTVYRVACRPTSANSITLRTFSVNSNAYLAAVSPGINWFLSKRLDQGAWTDVNTERPFMGLMVDGVDAGGGGGYPAIGPGLVRGF